MCKLHLKWWHPRPTGRVAEKVYAAQVGMANMFIYVAGDHVIAIDATSSEQALRVQLGRLPVEPSSVTHLFLTHSDFDHTSGLGAFPKAQIHLSRDEEQMINRTTARALCLYHNAAINRPYSLLADGDVVTVGPIKVRALATPGHTPGSMSYLVDDSVLFTGDTLSLRNGKACTFPRLLNMDTAAQKRSIRRLAGLEGILLLCTAHTGCTVDYGSAMAHWAF